MNLVEKKVIRIAESYWLIALANINDLIEFVIKIVKTGWSFDPGQTDWIDIAIKTVMAFGMIQIFRWFKAARKEMQEIRVMSTLSHYFHLENIVDSDTRFADAQQRLPMLQQLLEKEKAWMVTNISEQYKDMTRQDIEKMIDDFYHLSFVPKTAG